MESSLWKVLTRKVLGWSMPVVLAAGMSGCAQYGGDRGTEAAAEAPGAATGALKKMMEMSEAEAEEIPAGGAAMDGEAATVREIVVRGVMRDGAGTGAGAPPPPPPRVAAAAPSGVDRASLEEKKYNEVEVFFATDRKPTGSSTPGSRYGGERNRNRTGPLEYGKTVVSIPFNHRMGVVESPRWYRAEFSEDPQKHVVVTSLQTMGREDFFLAIKRETGFGARNQALLFVHGFNVPFSASIRRTAQLAYDLDFPGVAMAYSWPSQGNPAAYTVDRQMAEWTVPHLVQVLMDLKSQTGVQKVHIIAHSMGTWILTQALVAARNQGLDLDLNNIILAAPDIDADVFKTQILPKVKESTRRLTMYASSRDTALEASRRINGDDRLGLSGDHLVVLDGMDTVDASGIDTSVIGHSYYGNHELVVRDLLGLIVRGWEPPRRNLKRGVAGQWEFP